jgi:hypothetical protein
MQYSYREKTGECGGETSYGSVGRRREGMGGGICAGLGGGEGEAGGELMDRDREHTATTLHTEVT